MSDLFLAAYERARARFAEHEWLTLEPRQMTEAIYQAMRQLDAEMLEADRAPRATAAPRVARSRY